MRIISVLVLTAALGVLAGCGSSASSNPTAGVHATLHQFVNDLSSGNYSGACDLLTANVKAQLGGSQCASRLASVMQLNPNAKKQLQASASKIDSTPVTAHGDQATTRGSGGGGTTYVRQGNRWLISGGVGG